MFRNISFTLIWFFINWLFKIMYLCGSSWTNNESFRSWCNRIYWIDKKPRGLLNSLHSNIIIWHLSYDNINSNNSENKSKPQKVEITILTIFDVNWFGVPSPSHKTTFAYKIVCLKSEDKYNKTVSNIIAPHINGLNFKSKNLDFFRELNFLIGKTAGLKILLLFLLFGVQGILFTGSLTIRTDNKQSVILQFYFTPIDLNCESRLM